MRILSAMLIAFVFASSAGAQEKGKEKDIYDYVAQAKADKAVKKVVFIAGVESHGPKGNHEFRAGAIYLARTLNAAYPNCYAVVHPNTRWPKDLSHADCVIVLLNGGDKAAKDPAIVAAVKRGAGFMAVHWGVEVEKGKAADNYLKWMGGYFESFYSVNPFWTAKFTKIPEHETTRGVKPFEIHDEWYYHMRFVDDMKGVTPVLSAVPDVETITKRWNGKKASPRDGNDHALADVKAGKPQHVAWAYDRPDGGRGFGFTGFHNYNNLKNDSYRTLLLNAAAWTSKLEVPAKGIATPTPTADDLEQLLQDGLRLTK
jgi:Trehalose utilisation